MEYFLRAVVCALILGICMSSNIRTPPAIENSDLVPGTGSAGVGHEAVASDQDGAKSAPEVPVHLTNDGNYPNLPKAPVPKLTDTEKAPDHVANLPKTPVTTSKVILASETRILVVERLPGDMLADCTMYTNIEMFNIKDSEMPVVNVTDESIGEMDRACQMFKAKRDGLYRHKRGIALVYPGTEWCGAGSSADDYEHLGHKDEVDRCCRAHDHCPVSIGAMATEHDITNIAVWTKSHCDCDSAFYLCLKEAGDSIIGILYFNTLDIGCIKMDFQYKCVQDGFLFGCARYEPDYSLPQIYHFQDNHLVY